MFELAFIAVCLLIVAYIAIKVARSGFFSNIQPIVTETPKYVGKSLTVYYKHHIGAYSGVKSIFKEDIFHATRTNCGTNDTYVKVYEVRDLLPHGATTFGIYYDNPRERDEHLLQSAIGVIFGENGKDNYTDNYAQQLTRWGYEKMVLPKVDRAVEVSQPNDGALSIFALSYRTYGIVRQFIEDNRLESSLVLEFYDDKEICITFPLDHVNEFMIPELLSIEDLEARLVKKKFDSDEESMSESEAEALLEAEAVDNASVTLESGAGGDKKAD